MEKALEKYPRVVAHLVAESLGYFSPKSAAMAVEAHKNGQEYWCEWYMAMRTKTKGIVEVNREVISRAVKNRHFHRGYMSDYYRARALVNAYRAHPVSDPLTELMGSW